MSEGPIIAATDFSSAARRGVAEAMRLAAQQGLPLIVVHVIPPLVAPTPLLDEVQLGQLSVELHRDMLNAAQREMELLSQENDAPEVIETKILDGDPSRELLNLCQKRNASLLVLGAHGAGALNELMFGSVARRMVRRAPCSVLIVRPEEK